eukprot:gene46047-62369_t
MYASSQSGNIGLNGLGRAGDVSAFGGLTYDSAVTGYNFKGVGDLPVSVYAGFDKLNYRPGLGGALAPFSTDSSLAAGYSARAGIAFQPAANVTLSFEAGFTQQQQSDGDAASRLLPSGRRRRRNPPSSGSRLTMVGYGARAPNPPYMSSMLIGAMLWLHRPHR